MFLLLAVPQETRDFRTEARHSKPCRLSFASAIPTGVGGAAASEAAVAPNVDVVNEGGTPFDPNDVILCFLPVGEASWTPPLTETELIFEIMFISRS